MPSFDENRPWRHLYGSRWRRIRAAHLQANPLCVMCSADGIVKPASVVDHRQPHKGDAALFYNPGNLQSLCKRHHDADKQAIEKLDEKAPPMCRPDGYPVNGDW